VGFIRRLCGDIKKIAPQIIIILGGPEVSFVSVDSSDISDMPFDGHLYDYVIAGEGERAFFCLLHDLNKINGNNISDCKNYKEKFGYKIDENGNGKKISCDEITDLSEIPFIYSHTDISLFNDRIIYYESSRGCPFSCSYCLSAQGGRVRYLPLERVYSDINFFISNSKENSIKQVKFVVRTFNSDRNRAYAIFEYIISNSNANNAAENSKKIQNYQNYHFEICADLLDERVINLLSKAEAGLIQFEIGIQTTNPKALEMCARKTDIKKSFDNINLLLQNKNIHIHVDLIAGLPEDTLESFKDAFNQVYALQAHQFQLGFLKLLRGAPLNNQVEQYGYKFSSNPPYEILGNDNISGADLILLSGVEIALDKFYNSGKFAESLHYLIDNNNDCCNYFKTPFDFYLRLSEYMLRHDWLYRAVSLDNLYNILLGFADSCDCGKNVSDSINLNHLKEKLLLDYHSCDNYDKPPKAVRDIWKPYNSYKDSYNDMVRKSGLKNATIRKIGSTFYYFDYSKKNPVTNRYDKII
jgi:hypothetical protein